MARSRSQKALRGPTRPKTTQTVERAGGEASPLRTAEFAGSAARVPPSRAASSSCPAATREARRDAPDREGGRRLPRGRVLVHRWIPRPPPQILAARADVRTRRSRQIRLPPGLQPAPG